MASENKKTLKLKIEDKVNFCIIGISSHENDYRLVWSVNEQLKMQFIRTDNLVIHNQKLNQDLEFSKYVFNDEDRYLKYCLISNRCPDGFLLSEFKNLDFIVQIIGVLHKEELNVFLKNLKQVQIISAAYVLPAEKIKGIGKILQDN